MLETTTTSAASRTGVQRVEGGAIGEQDDTALAIMHALSTAWSSRDRRRGHRSGPEHGRSRLGDWVGSSLSPPALPRRSPPCWDRPDSQPLRNDRQEVLNRLALPASTGAPAVIKTASARTSKEVVTLIDRACVFRSASPA